MENNKSPGIDGVTIEFCKEFLAHIENDLFQLYQNILQNKKEATKIMKQAIITLLPKEGIDKNYDTGDQYLSYT